MPLVPSKPFGAVQIALRVAKLVPLKPLHCWICHFGPLLVSQPPATYSDPLRQARPDANAGEPASLTPWPPLSRYTPPLGTLLVSAPPSPSKTLPAPTANDVGVFSPAANCVTVWPPGAVGGGGGPAAPADVAPTPNAAVAIMAIAAAFARILFPSRSYPRDTASAV